MSSSAIASAFANPDIPVELAANILFSMVRSGTPLLIVALGELVCERSGILNLGQEGMMLVGAVIGFIVAIHTGSLPLAVGAAAAAGVAMALLFGAVVIDLAANQVAAGLALTIVGTGLSSFLGATYVGRPLVGFAPVAIPVLSDIPVVGRMLFTHDVLVYLGFALFALVYRLLNHSRWGLIVNAVGESPRVAVAVGLPVRRVRYLAVAFGGAMAGLGGGYLSLAYTPFWADRMTTGKGWIALALVVFASWRVGRVILGAWLFGLASILTMVLQALGLSLAGNLLNILPYVATIAVLVILSHNQGRSKLVAPMSLGRPFRTGDS